LWITEFSLINHCGDQIASPIRAGADVQHGSSEPPAWWSDLTDDGKQKARRVFPPGLEREAD